MISLGEEEVKENSRKGVKERLKPKANNQM